MEDFIEKKGYAKAIIFAIKGIFTALILLVFSLIILFWNENRSKEQAFALAQMEEEIISLSTNQYHEKYDNKAILVQGMVQPLHEIFDPDFLIQSKALILHREVQMYQWAEENSNNTSYDYIKKWSLEEIHSIDFQEEKGHHNPLMPYQSKSFATEAMLGDFYLDKEMIMNIGVSEPLESLEGQVKDFIYRGKNINTPKIGDIKITYRYTKSAIYTFAGKALDGTLSDFVSSNGVALAFAREGKISTKELFEEEHNRNIFLTYLLRAITFLLMFLGFNLILKRLNSLNNTLAFSQQFFSEKTALKAGLISVIFYICFFFTSHI